MVSKILIVSGVIVAIVVIVLLVKKGTKEGYDGISTFRRPYGKEFSNFGCGNGSTVPCDGLTPEDYGKLSIFQRNWANMIEWTRRAGIDYINQGGLTLNGFVGPLEPVLTTRGKVGGVPGGDGSNTIGLSEETPIPNPGTIGLHGSTVPKDTYQVKQAQDAISGVYSYYYDTGDSTATADKITRCFNESNKIAKLVFTDIFQGFDTTQHMDMWREWALNFANVIADLSPQYYQDDAAKNTLVTTIYTAMVEHIELTRDQIWQYNSGNMENSLDVFIRLQGQTLQFSNMLFELIIMSTN